MTPYDGRSGFDEAPTTASRRAVRSRLPMTLSEGLVCGTCAHHMSSGQKLVNRRYSGPLIRLQPPTASSSKPAVRLSSLPAALCSSAATACHLSPRYYET